MLRTRVLLLAALSATALFAQEKKEEKKEERREEKPAGRRSEPAARPTEARPSQESRPAPQNRPAETAPANRQPMTAERPQPAVRQNSEPINRPNNFPANRSVTPAPAASFGRSNSMAPDVAPNAGRVVRNPNGAEVHYGPRGEVREVRRGDMVIAHGPNGMRRVEVARPDGRVIVASGFGRGYVQRPYVFQNATIVQRTYFVGGVAYPRIYRPFFFRGISINVYVPTRYYAPAFYGYAYAPWARPVIFNFGFAATPWFGFYGGYFAPYPVYSSPSMWLTDYIISQQLQAAYQQQMAANAQAAAYPPQYGGGQPGLTPEVKQAISDEVRQQLALENSERQAGPNALPDPASSGIARMLSDGNPHVFVVSTPFSVPTSDGGECPVTDGDVLQLAGPTAPNAPSANLVVLASKGRDCRKGSQVAVNVADLQDMQNQMRATLDQGLGELQAKQGTGGLPPAPPAAAAPPVQPQFAALAPPPDPNGVADVNSQWQQATQADQATPDLGQGGPVRIALGQTLDQVSAALGNPMNIVDLGAKKIYVYPNMKITFLDGRVSDVQ